MSMLKVMALAWMASALAHSDGPVVGFPDVERPPVREAGVATWYGDYNWHGDYTADGDLFRPYREATCAHRTLPLGTVIMVQDPDTGRTIWCPVTDRGPYIVVGPDGKRRAVDAQYVPGPDERWEGVVDMSAEAAKQLGTYDKGLFRARLMYWTPPDDRGTRIAHSTRWDAP